MSPRVTWRPTPAAQPQQLQSSKVGDFNSFQAALGKIRLLRDRQVRPDDVFTVIKNGDNWAVTQYQENNLSQSIRWDDPSLDIDVQPGQPALFVDHQGSIAQLERGEDGAMRAVPVGSDYKVEGSAKPHDADWVKGPDAPPAVGEKWVSGDDLAGMFPDGIDVAKASGARRLKDAGLGQADLNGDGRVMGAEEFNRYAAEAKTKEGGGVLGFLKSVVGKEVEDKNRDAEGRIRLQDEKGKLTGVGGQVQAMKHFANAEKVPGPGEPGYDPFRPDMLVTSKAFKGEPMDVSIKRSADILTRTEATEFLAKFGVTPKDDEVVIANLRHDNNWFVARIPADCVDDVYFQRLGVHGEIRFKMKEGKEAKLYPQIEGDSTPPMKLDDLCYTLEATNHEDYKYNVLKGVGSEYNVAHRMTSMQEKYRQEILGNNSEVKQWRLKIDDDRKQLILANCLNRGEEAGLNEVYSTLNNNCTTEARKHIDNAMDYSPWQIMDNLETLFVHPGLAQPNLWLRGLTGADKKTPNLQTEWKDGIPETPPIGDDDD